MKIYNVKFKKEIDFLEIMANSEKEAIEYAYHLLDADSDFDPMDFQEIVEETQE